MKFSGEFHDDGTITVFLPSGAHRVTEACFRFDGPEPVADLSHILGDGKSAAVSAPRFDSRGEPRGLDSPPDEHDEQRAA